MPKPTPEQHEQARAHARAQFREWLADPACTVIDTETTSLQGSVWDFAAVPLGSAAPILAFVAAVPEDAAWSERAAEYFEARQLRLPAEGIEAHAAPLLDVLQRRRVIAYGAEFDHARLAHTLREAGCVSEFPAFGCAMDAYAPLTGAWSESRQTWKSCPLDVACTREGVDLSDLPRHSAYGDAVATARLIRAVAGSLDAGAGQDRAPVPV